MHRRRVYIGLTVSLVLATLPYMLLPLMSFFGRWHYPSFLPDSWTLEHWLLFQSSQSNVGTGLLLSLGIACATASLASIGGLLLSRVVSYSGFRNGGLFFSLLPVTMSPVLFATILLFYFQVAGLAGTVAGVIVAQLLIALPFSIIYFHSFWSIRILRLEELSATLGSKPWQTYRRIIWPVVSPFLLVCFFQTFIISWLEYGLTSVIGAGQVQTLTLKVFGYIQESNPSMAALSSTLLIIPPALLLWWNRHFVLKEVNL